MFAKGLLSASGTLQSLVLCIWHYYKGDTIGSLCHFTALKHLCVQGHLLLGEDDDPSDDEPQSEEVLPGLTMMGDLLPLSLEKLELHNSFYDDESEFPKDDVLGLDPARWTWQLLTCRIHRHGYH